MDLNDPKDTAPAYLSPREAADFLRITVRALLHRVQRGQIPAYRLGGRALRFRREEIEAVLRPVVLP